MRRLIILTLVIALLAGAVATRAPGEPWQYCFYVGHERVCLHWPGNMLRPQGTIIPTTPAEAISRPF